jgi:predicted pyridoxine 5'-phosphate oxidase superfamily flavin-nucleotide-binding protein
MARVYDRIDEHHRTWIARQPMFFVASAPLDDEGHVNVSPKGPIGSLRVLDDHTLAYLDISGSGAETIAHVRENGRIVVMLCAFEGPPRIMRFHGRGTVVFPHEERYAELMERCAFDELSIPEARRAVIVVDVTRVSDSCGYGVPLMSFEGIRPHHEKSSAKKLRVMGIEAYAEYRRTKNRESLDGLPAVDVEQPLEVGP